jgi:hypothetical protein
MILILVLLYMGKNSPFVILTSKASFNERMLRLRSESNMQTWYIILRDYMYVYNTQNETDRSNL